jgi:hypothetical protein
MLCVFIKKKEPFGSSLSVLYPCTSINSATWFIGYIFRDVNLYTALSAQVFRIVPGHKPFLYVSRIAVTCIAKEAFHHLFLAT